MTERTCILGEELEKAIERADEVLAAHDTDKGRAWEDKDWKEHFRRAIAHLTNALCNAKDGSEIEASHGTVRAIMGLRQLLKTIPEDDRKACASHARKRLPFAVDIERVIKRF
jgi:hypothetical protein